MISLMKGNPSEAFTRSFHLALLNEVNFWLYAVEVTPDGLQCKEDFKERLQQAKVKLALYDLSCYPDAVDGCVSDG